MADFEIVGDFSGEGTLEGSLVADHLVAGGFSGEGSFTGSLVQERPIAGSFSGAGTFTLDADDIEFDRLISATLGAATLDFELEENLFIIERSQVWWDTHWLYRRNIWVQPNSEGIEAEHPIVYYLSNHVISQNKMRSDLADLEVLRLVSFVPEVWVRVPFIATLGANTIEVLWENETDTAAGTDIRGVYYVYYGNHELTGDEDVGVYEAPAYPVSLTPESARLSYTRPGEHWVTESNLSISRVLSAKVTVRFDGDQIRIQAFTGPLWGVAEAQIDDGEWTSIDLYASVAGEEEEVVFEQTGLGLGEHTLRYRHSGTKNPAALTTDINFSHIEYRKNAKAIDLGEEANETLLWGSVIGGVVGGT